MTLVVGRLSNPKRPLHYYVPLLHLEQFSLSSDILIFII
jgi:hypothetical protein